MAPDEPAVTTVTSKGQITIPSSLRDEFGLEQGTKLIQIQRGNPPLRGWEEARPLRAPIHRR